MSDEAARTVGFIGLGRMGLPMTSRLLEAGHRVVAFDISPDAREHAGELGAKPVTTPADAARGVDLLILMLPSSKIVGSVVEELLDGAALTAPTLVIDMSSSEPQETRRLATELGHRGVDFIDAPVSGGVKGATAGTLTIMAGGDAEDVQRARPVLESLGRVTHAGPVGAGHAVKALNNLLSATHLWISSEAISIGRSFGLAPEVMLSIFNSSSGRSGSTENKWPNFVLPETYDSGFGLGLMVKDMKIATALAEQTGRPTALGQQAVALWERAASDLGADADHTEVARWIDQHSG